MKSIQNNIWAKLSSGQKLNLIGSGLLIISLFLNWYTDTDIFHSGDTYSGLSGPLYMVGLTFLVVAVANMALIAGKVINFPGIKNLGVVKLGRWQMMFSFSAMYLLILTNSVYFSPQFGLNILNKRSDIGTMAALIAVVMICVGGYLGYRKKFEMLEAAKNAVAVEKKVETVAAAPIPVLERQAEPARVHAGVNVRSEVVAKSEKIKAAVEAKEAVAAPVPVAEKMASGQGNDGSYFSERDPRGKTDYERTKLYENLRKTMMRDTMSPQQREKERKKEASINAFSSSFGKGVKGGAAKSAPVVTVGSMAAQVESKQESSPAAKKPQMYRLDL